MKPVSGRRFADRAAALLKARLPAIMPLALCCCLCALAGCATGAISAEEYFSIGMAYFEMGKFEEAEKWLNRAKAKDRTQSASEYNLGRIAFETGRYEDALRHFNTILKRDPENIMALKAAAYTSIKNGEIEKAAGFYGRVLKLVPDSADDGYNHALVLFAMEKYAEAEHILKSHEFALLDNSDVLLLYARAQKEQGKPEAIDTYAKWLVNNTDAKVQYEYAQLLESGEQYARALEEYRQALAGLAANAASPSRPDIRFAIARVLLIADPENADGVAELKGAVEDGFADLEKMQALYDDGRVKADGKDEIRVLLAEMNRAAEAAQAQAAAQAALEAEAAAAAAEEAAAAAAAEVPAAADEGDPEAGEDGEAN